MNRVYTAIGPFWRVIMLDRPDYSIAKNSKKLGQMCEFQECNRIIDHMNAPGWDSLQHPHLLQPKLNLDSDASNPVELLNDKLLGGLLVLADGFNEKRCL
ncbi:hypothetical protein A2U01_0040882, partial [Trifolium medium]|nr:hypothetical protein [Trifolium medium]